MTTGQIALLAALMVATGALGAITGWVMASVPGRGVQRMLAVATAVAVAASWWLALRAA